ncbi:MAG TPA: S8 family serine peptidase, partial [Anaerolineaceae bacterium]|nr:S8 family serine peptidase [Anaerolineaceae bacterium]
MKSRFFRFVSVLVILSMVLTPALSASAQTPTPPERTAPQRTPVSRELQPAGSTPKTSGLELVPAVVDDVPAPYIITLPDKPLATYMGGVSGLNATSPRVTGQNQLDVTSADSKAYVAYLKAQQASFLSVASEALGREPKVLFDYQYATNGMSLFISATEAQKLSEIPGVKVYKASIETPLTDVGPTLIGAPAIWDGETASGLETKGEDIIVGIIDTGINFDHPSFAPTSTIDPYVYPVAAKYFGVCDPTNALQYDPAYAAACNNKLIGAFTYVKGDPDESQTPEDSEGHGSHTASTVAGNMIAVIYDGINVTISGVAPHARIISFDVCVPTPPNGACYGDATVKAVDDALLTGVDVTNYSISGGENPYGDPVELAFLSATEAGIF